MIGWLSASTAFAQWPAGVGPDAATLPSRALRISFGIGWDRAPERYENGVLRSPGDRYSLDTLGATVFPFLGVTEAATRAAAGLPAFRASLGASVVKARDALETTPVTVEYGLTSRVSLRATVPFVTAAARVDATLNPLAREATVGLNPALANAAIATAYSTLLTQLGAAGSFLGDRIASCPSNPAAPGCAAVLASPATAQALVAEARTFATALAALYGGSGANPGALFIPLAGSATQAAITARLAGIRGQFAAFGAPAITALAPIGAPAPLTIGGFQDFLADTAFGIESRGLRPVVRRGVGNAEFATTIRLFDSRRGAKVGASPSAGFWVRTAATVAYSLGAPNPAADELIGAPLGTVARGLRVGAMADGGHGSRYSFSVAASRVSWAGTAMDVRALTQPGAPFPSAAGTASVTYTPGAEWRLDAAPRLAISEAIGIAATWTYRRRDADAFALTGQTPSPSASAFDVHPGMNSVGPSSTEHRFGASIGYSTIAAWERGQAQWPLDIVLTHYQTTTASGGTVPKVSHDDIVLRWYWRSR
ncbi:MAG: hypothetical protein IT356_12060 [Gemmatimonadaceae bacterium]|nr:hypothetical protein [Gemmatimonadaceae bacterium]